jgi:hypothetical protein
MAHVADLAANSNTKFGALPFGPSQMRVKNQLMISHSANAQGGAGGSRGGYSETRDRLWVPEAEVTCRREV